MGKKTERRRARLEQAAAAAPHPPRPEHSGRRVAHALLVPRLRDVYLRPSLPWPEDARALVHDTRVASRRFVEALELARPMLDAKAFSRSKRDAKALRRSLGARREADVMRADFDELVTSAGLSPDVAEPVERALAEKGARAFAEARARWTARRLLRAADRVLEALAEPIPDLGWRDLAAPHLYDRAVRPEARLPALRDPAASPTHHALRVDFKHLRYATEILAPVFPEVLDGPTLVKRLKGLQDALGVLQDADDLIAFLGSGVVESAVAPSDHGALLALARQRKAERYARARDAVLDAAPGLLGELRRASGKIGLFPR